MKNLSVLHRIAFPPRMLLPLVLLLLHTQPEWSGAGMYWTFVEILKTPRFTQFRQTSPSSPHLPYVAKKWQEYCRFPFRWACGWHFFKIRTPPSCAHTCSCPLRAYFIQYRTDRIKVTWLIVAPFLFPPRLRLWYYWRDKPSNIGTTLLFVIAHFAVVCSPEVLYFFLVFLPRFHQKFVWHIFIISVYISALCVAWYH